MRRLALRLFPFLACWSVACAHLPPAAAPADPWLQYATPEEAGFSPTGLEAAFRLADQAGSAAVMAVHRGQVLLAWGDVARELELHSVRKSLYSALFGIALQRQALALDDTLGELGIDDLRGLSAAEGSARVADLLAARSGVYHPSAYSPADMDEGLPARGSHPPGTFFYYNNWDFNAAAGILEQAIGIDLYHAFERWIAEPIGMEDYDPADGYRAFEPTVSRWPAHTFRMSTRDLARFGQLYLQGGRWRGRQVVPVDWIERSTRAVSRFEDGSGYGFMWWVYPAGSLPAERYPTARDFDIVQARGTGGQALFLVPGAELAVVHRGDTDRDRGVSGRAVWSLLEAILAARQGSPAARPKLMPLVPRPLPNAQRAPERPPIVAFQPGEVEALLGRYEFAPGVHGRVFLFGGRPYMQVPREGEAELFALADGTYTIRVEPGVSIRAERDAAGRVVALVARLGEREMRASKVD